MIALLGLLGVAGVGVPAAHAGVQDFTFDSFDAQYLLDMDAVGHSTLKTTETLVAEFPATDQNHGIVRTIPSSFDGHGTGLQVVSVADENGNQRNYATQTHAEEIDLLIGDTDTFVHGKQTYVITYTEVDVIGREADGTQSFTWNVNGLGWSQPFSKVTASIGLSDKVQYLVNGEPECTLGPAVANDDCTVGPSAAGYDLTATSIGPAETMTAFVSFQPDAFTLPHSSAAIAPTPPPSPFTSAQAGQLFGVVLLIYAIVFGIAFLFGLVYYVLMAIALMAFFRKVGVAPWIAWVPFYNTWKWLEVGGQEGWFSLLSLVGASIVPAIFLAIGMHRTGIAFGKRDASWVVLGIFLPFVWCFLMARTEEVYRPEWIAMAGYPPPRAGYGSMPPGTQPAPAYPPHP